MLQLEKFKGADLEIIHKHTASTPSSSSSTLVMKSFQISHSWNKGLLINKNIAYNKHMKTMIRLRQQKQ